MFVLINKDFNFMSIAPIQKYLSQLPVTIRTQVARHPVLAAVGLTAVVFAARKAYLYGTTPEPVKTTPSIAASSLPQTVHSSPVQAATLSTTSTEAPVIPQPESPPPVQAAPVIPQPESPIRALSPREYVSEIRNFCSQISPYPEIDFAQLRGTDLEQAEQLREAALKVKDLRSNVRTMTKVPSGWRHFPNVEIIYLRDMGCSYLANQPVPADLSALSAESHFLRKLNNLVIERNNLEELPEELAKLPNTCRISARENPIDEPAKKRFLAQVLHYRPSFGPTVRF